MRELRVLAVVSAVAVSMVAGVGLALAQAPVAKPAGSKASAAAKTATAPKTSSGDPAPKPPVPPGKQDAQLQAIYRADEAWRESQRGAGDMRRPEKVLPVLPAVDPTTQEKAYEHWKSVKTQIDKLADGEMSEPERVNLMVYRYQIDAHEEMQKFKEYQRPVTSLESFWAGLQEEPRKPFRNEQDFLNYLSWLADIPRFFDENIANMKAGEARGFTAPKVTLAGRDQTIAMVANAKSADATTFWQPFKHMPGTVNEAEQARLRAEAKKTIEQKVLPAYQTLLTYWNTEYYPNTVKSTAAEDLPDGKAYYRSLIKRFTTLETPPEEIHAFGLQEMAKIHQEMLDTMAEAKFDGDLPAFLKFLRTDPQFYPKTPEELMKTAAYEAKEFDDKADRYFGYMPRLRYGIIPVPLEVAPFVPMGFGGAREYQVNTYDLPSRALYSLPSLSLHESAPGHAWQGEISLEHTDLPKFRTAYISAYGEGWALYCERLGTEMDMYHTPYEKFGMLSFQAWRASRLVVDTGLHAMGWTREQAQQYLRENTALSEHDVEEEIDRYISWPAQALSYYLGMTEILKERKHAEEVLGPKFNIRAFHDAVLETGAVPLPVLDEHLEAWIKGGGIGPYPEMEK
jgi:uncharacterized protein (DUF885 family)